MGSVFRPKMPNGQISPKWYVGWQVAGKTRRLAIGTREAAQAALAKFEDAEVRRKYGLPNYAEEAAERNRALAELLELYIQNKEAKDTTPEHRANIRNQLARAIAECKWRTVTDIDPDAFMKFLGKLRDNPRPQEIRGAAKANGGPTHSRKTPARGLSPTTLNGYIRVMKAFGNWLAKRTKTASPFADIKFYREEVDLRRTKRILTDDELAKLLVATVEAKGQRRSRGAVRGEDRAMLYRLAAFTGLRAGELAELSPANFALDASPPTVTVYARDAKGKREEPIPLPDHLVTQLRDWFAKKPQKAKLFPGNWAKYRHESKWLVWDLGRAGINTSDERGRALTFHSLKRRFVVRLLHAGGKIHEVRRLARHKDIRTTLNHYVDENLQELGQLVNKLPPVDLGGSHKSRCHPEPPTDANVGWLSSV